MIKRSIFLINSFLLLSLSSSQSAKEATDLPKRIIKDLIIKYQINEKIQYLAQFLPLDRTTLENTFFETLEKYEKHIEDLQNSANSENYYSIDLRETEHKNDILKKMSLILEALYLASITTNDLKKNKLLYKKLNLKFHPDKLVNTDEETKKEKTEFFQNIEPLLSSNTNDNCLNDMIKSIHEKRNEIIEQINNPPLLKTILNNAVKFNCATTLPVIGEAFGIALCNKTFAKLIPNSPQENKYRNECVANIRQSALQIEMKLIKLSRYP